MTAQLSDSDEILESVVELQRVELNRLLAENRRLHALRIGNIKHMFMWSKRIYRGVQRLGMSQCGTTIQSIQHGFSREWIEFRLC